MLQCHSYNKQFSHKVEPQVPQVEFYLFLRVDAVENVRFASVVGHFICHLPFRNLRD